MSLHFDQNFDNSLQFSCFLIEDRFGSKLPKQWSVLMQDVVSWQRTLGGWSD